MMTAKTYAKIACSNSSCNGGKIGYLFDCDECLGTNRHPIPLTEFYEELEE